MKVETLRTDQILISWPSALSDFPHRKGNGKSLTKMLRFHMIVI